MTDVIQQTARSSVTAVRIVSILTCLIWFAFGINVVLGMSLNNFGIYPREPDALPGIMIWPFLHGSLTHLVMNTPPLLVMGFLVALRGTSFFVSASLIITLASGLGVWCFGREAYHIGASGLVFGYFGLLLVIGVYERRFSSLLISIVVGFYYGGMTWTSRLTWTLRTQIAVH